MYFVIPIYRAPILNNNTQFSHQSLSILLSLNTLSARVLTTKTKTKNPKFLLTEICRKHLPATFCLPACLLPQQPLARASQAFAAACSLRAQRYAPLRSVLPAYAPVRLQPRVAALLLLQLCRTSAVPAAPTRPCARIPTAPAAPTHTDCILLLSCARPSACRLRNI
jgi:hypothetical protein